MRSVEDTIAPASHALIMIYNYDLIASGTNTYWVVGHGIIKVAFNSNNR